VTKLQLSNEQVLQYGSSFNELDVEITPETASRLHVKIKPAGHQRWEVPESIVPRYESGNFGMLVTCDPYLACTQQQQQQHQHSAASELQKHNDGRCCTMTSQWI
jgi:hypothetical protein